MPEKTALVAGASVWLATSPIKRHCRAVARPASTHGGVSLGGICCQLIGSIIEGSSCSPIPKWKPHYTGSLELALDMLGLT
jgi:hypothetical protein